MVIFLAFFVGPSVGPAVVVIKGVVVTVWYLILALFANYLLGYIGIPLITVLFGAALLIWLIKSQAESMVAGNEKDSLQRQKPSLFERINENILETSLGIKADGTSTDSEQDEDKDGNGEEVEAEKNKCEAVDIDEMPYLSGEGSSEDCLRQRRSVHFGKTATVDVPPSSEDWVKPVPLQTSYSVDSPSAFSHSESLQSILKKSESRQFTTVTNIFLVLTTTCFLVMLWRNMWLLLLIVPMVLWSLVKRPLVMQLPFVSLLYNKSMRMFDSLLIEKKELLCPQPLPILVQLCQRLDRKLLRVLKSSVGTIMSAGIIIALVVGGVGLFVFFVLEVQVEVAYAVNLMKQLLNSSVIESPWLNR